MKLVKVMVIIMTALIAQSSAEQQIPLIGAQVFIEPGQDPAHVEEWFKSLKENDMPVCRIRMFEEHINKGNGKWDFSLYDNAFDLAEKYGVKVSATIFPTDPTVGGFKFPRDEQHLKDIGVFIDALVKQYKDHPALDTWVLINEPGTGGYDRNPFALKKFEEWQARQPKKAKVFGAAFDDMEYELFWRDYTTWYLNWIAERIWTQDREHMTHVNNHQLFMNLTEYDFPNWMPFLSSLGASIHAAWHLGYFTRDQYTLGISANCDIIRDAAAPKPFWVTELQGGNNIFSGMDPLCPNDKDIAQWLWTCIGSGAERIIYWCLNPRATGAEAGEWALLNFQNKPSDRIVMTAKIAKIINDNAEFFANAKSLKAPVTLLYSPESMITFGSKIQSNEYGDNYAGRKKGAHIKSVLAYYQTLQELGIPCELKQIDHFDWNRTDKHTAILANAVTLPSPYIKKLEDYTAKGNKLVITGMTGYFDENMHNSVQSTDPLQKLLGASLSEYKFSREDFTIPVGEVELPAHMLKGEIFNRSAKIISKQENIVYGVRNSFGKGEVVYIPSLIGLGSWQKDNAALASFLSKEITTDLPVTLASHQAGLMLKTMKNGNSFMTVLINSTEEKIETEFTSELKPKLLFTTGGELAGKRVAIQPQATLVIKWN